VAQCALERKQPSSHRFRLSFLLIFKLCNGEHKLEIIINLEQLHTGENGGPSTSEKLGKLAGGKSDIEHDYFLCVANCSTSFM